MLAGNLDYPRGRSLLYNTLTRVRRPFVTAMQPRVQSGDTVRPDQAIAENVQQQIFAGVAGKVATVEPDAIVIDCATTLVQGILGMGGAITGPLTTLPRGGELAVAPIIPGSILILPHRAPLVLLQRAAAMGAHGIVAASASARDLEAFTRADLTAALDGTTAAIQSPLTILLTEGVGEAPMDPAIFHLLSQSLGRFALLDGTTSLQTSQRPELLISPPLAPPSAVNVNATTRLANIEPGARVAVLTGPRRSTQGVVVHLFTYPQPAPSGQMYISALVAFSETERAVLPLAALALAG